MTGARQLARDYIAPLLRSGEQVLDVCCGSGWAHEIVEAAGCEWIGIEKFGEFPDSVSGCPRRIIGNVLKGETYLKIEKCSDLILDIYGTQHLMHEQALAFDKMRGEVTDSGRLIYVGRYTAHPCRETDRQDPLNAYNRAAFEGLALASGWSVKQFKVAEYSGDTYKWSPLDYATLMDCHPNAFCALLEPI